MNTKSYLPINIRTQKNIYNTNKSTTNEVNKDARAFDLNVQNVLMSTALPNQSSHTCKRRDIFVGNRSDNGVLVVNYTSGQTAVSGTQERSDRNIEETRSTGYVT